VPANSVGTRQVINASLQTADLSKTARTALKGNRGANGSPGRRSPVAAANDVPPSAKKRANRAT
jgi:hypothetical protein